MSPREAFHPFETREAREAYSTPRGPWRASGGSRLR